MWGAPRVRVCVGRVRSVQQYSSRYWLLVAGRSASLGVTSRSVPAAAGRMVSPNLTCSPRCSIGIVPLYRQRAGAPTNHSGVEEGLSLTPSPPIGHGAPMFAERATDAARRLQLRLGSAASARCRVVALPGDSCRAPATAAAAAAAPPPVNFAP